MGHPDDATYAFDNARAVQGERLAALADTAAEVGAERGDVLGWDVMTHPVEPSARIGRERDLIAAPRLDNLATSYAGVRALVDAAESEPGHVPVLVLFDHEEIGSASPSGGPALVEVLAARSGRGAVSFLLAEKPFCASDVADFGDRLARHVGRGVHLVVCGWPAERLDVLRAWRQASPAELARRVTVA